MIDVQAILDGTASNPTTGEREADRVIATELALAVRDHWPARDAFQVGFDLMLRRLANWPKEFKLIFFHQVVSRYRLPVDTRLGGTDIFVADLHDFLCYCTSDEWSAIVGSPDLRKSWIDEWMAAKR